MAAVLNSTEKKVQSSVQREEVASHFDRNV